MTLKKYIYKKICCTIIVIYNYTSLNKSKAATLY